MPVIDPTTPPGTQPVGFTAGYTLTMSDEFNSTTLDSKWRAFRDFGDFQAPIAWDVNSSNNSALRFWWTGNTGNDNIEFGSTGSTPFRQRFGFYEARIKMIRGRGFFPAFWLYPQSDGGTENSDGQQQEVDIVEWFSFENGDWLVDTTNFRCKNAKLTIWTEGGGGATTLHGERYLGGHVDPVTGQVDPYDTTLSTEYHVYGMRWHATDGFQWYIDGVPRGSPISDPWGAGNNMQLAVFLQAWWGPLGGNPTPDGNTPASSSNAIEFDWVRCYSFSGTETTDPDPGDSTFHVNLVTAPNDGATLSGNVPFRVDGEQIGNVELLPPTGYTPVYLRFTVAQNGTTATGNWDTTALSNGPITVRISAFDSPPGGDGNELIAMSARTYTIANIQSLSTDPSLAQTFCVMDYDSGKYIIK